MDTLEAMLKRSLIELWDGRVSFMGWTLAALVLQGIAWGTWWYVTRVML